jgi:hypothetical protein
VNIERLQPSTHVDTLGYAVALLDGAIRIAQSARTPKTGEIGIPFYLLIGFSLENSLKALLQYKVHYDAEWRWNYSHDLSRLFAVATGYGLKTHKTVREIVDGLSQPHKEFYFRYPGKAAMAEVFKPVSALVVTSTLISAVFDLIDINPDSLS